MIEEVSTLYDFNGIPIRVIKKQREYPGHGKVLLGG